MVTIIVLFGPQQRAAGTSRDRSAAATAIHGRPARALQAHTLRHPAYALMIRCAAVTSRAQAASIVARSSLPLFSPSLRDGSRRPGGRRLRRSASHSRRCALQAADIVSAACHRGDSWAASCRPLEATDSLLALARTRQAFSGLLRGRRTAWRAARASGSALAPCQPRDQISLQSPPCSCNPPRVSPH